MDVDNSWWWEKQPTWRPSIHPFPCSNGRHDDQKKDSPHTYDRRIINWWDRKKSSIYGQSFLHSHTLSSATFWRMKLRLFEFQTQITVRKRKKIGVHELAMHIRDELTRAKACLISYEWRATAEAHWNMCKYLQESSQCLCYKLLYYINLKNATRWKKAV